MPPKQAHKPVELPRLLRVPSPNVSQSAPSVHNGTEQSPRAHLQPRSSPKAQPMPNVRNDMGPSLQAPVRDTKLVRNPGSAAIARIDPGLHSREHKGPHIAGKQKK